MRSCAQLVRNVVIVRQIRLYDDDDATAAIEYVAAGHFFPGDLLTGGLLSGGPFARGHFWPGGLLAGGFLSGVLFYGVSFARGTFVWGAYARSPQVQCVYAPSRLSMPSIIA